jgi:hypothetical protein
LLARPLHQSAQRRAFLVISLAWALSFGVAYHLTYRAASLSPYLARYWAPAFLAPGADFLEHSWLVLKDVVWGFIAGHGGVPRKPEAEPYVAVCAIIGVTCAIGGAWHLRRTHGGPTAMLIIGPIAVTIVASAIGLYPLGQRLLLFTVPLVLILGIAGLEGAVERLPSQWGRRVWLIAGGLVVPPLLAVSLWQAVALEDRSRMEPLLRTLDSHHRPGEAVWVFGRTLPSWAFYTTDWSRPDRPRLAFFYRVGRSGGPAFENAPSRGHRVTPDEGDGLVYRGPRGEEIIGIPTGMEYVSGRGLLQRRPDSGWVAREAERIRRAANPGVWVVMTEFLGPEFELLAELRRLGGQVTDHRFEPGHVIVRYEFAAAGTSSS